MSSDFDSIIRLYKKQLYDLKSFRFINHVYVKADEAVKAKFPDVAKFAMEWDSKNKQGTNLANYAFLNLIYHKNCYTYGIVYAMSNSNAVITRYLNDPKNFILGIDDFAFGSETFSSGQLTFEHAGSDRLTYVYIYPTGDFHEISVFRYGCETGKVVINKFTTDENSIYTEYVSDLGVCKCPF